VSRNSIQQRNLLTEKLTVAQLVKQMPNLMAVFNSFTTLFTKYWHWALLYILTPWLCTVHLVPFSQPRRTGRGGGRFQLFVLLNLLDGHAVELWWNIGTSQDIYLQRVRNHDLSVRTANDMYLALRAHRNGPHKWDCLTNIFLSLCSFLQEIHRCSSKIFVSQSLSPSFESHCLSKFLHCARYVNRMHIAV